MNAKYQAGNNTQPTLNRSMTSKLLCTPNNSWNNKIRQNNELDTTNHAEPCRNWGAIMFPAMRATEQKTIGNVSIISPKPIHIFSAKVSMNSPHQPGCLTSSSRRAGRFPLTSARSLIPLPPRTGFFLYGRHCASKYKTTQAVFYPDVAQFCLPYSNKLDPMLFADNSDWYPIGFVADRFLNLAAICGMNRRNYLLLLYFQGIH